MVNNNINAPTASIYQCKKTNYFYLNHWKDGKRIRRSLKTKDINEASTRARIETSITKKFDNKDVDLWALDHGGLQKMYRSAKDRARKANLEFEITFSDLTGLYKKTGGLCAITGLPFSMEELDNIKRRPFIPSLDRKDNTIGYTKKNCRLVCCAVNIAINEFGEEVFFAVARYFIKRRSEKRQSNYSM